MQVQPSYRKSKNRWVVDTRAVSVKKLNGARGEQKFFREYEDADAYAKKVNKAQDAGGTVTVSAAGTFDALVEKFADRNDERVRDGNIVFKHAESQKQHVTDFAQATVRDGIRFGELKVVDVTVHDIKELVGKLTVAYKTQKEHLRSLKIALDYAGILGWASWSKEDRDNPARKFRHENNKHNVTVEEVESEGDKIERLDLGLIATLVKNAMQYDKAVFSKKDGRLIRPAWCDGLALAFATTTGVSFGEHSAIKWKYINFAESEVKIYGANREVGKNRIGFGYGKADARRRVIPIGPAMLQALREWKARSPKSGDDDYVFITRSGEVQVSSCNWRNRVLVDCGKAVIEDCPHIRWHDLRHVYASILVEENQPGKSVEDGWQEIARLMGHSTIKTTFDHYVHWILDAEKNRKVGSAIEARVGLG